MLIKKKRLFLGLILILIGVVLFIYISSPTINEPEKNFNYLWNSFNRQYSNFECKEIDWDELYSYYRARITPKTKNHELFKVMVDLLKHLDDKHVYIRRFNRVYFSGYDLPILNYFQILKFDFRLPLKEFSLKLIRKKYIKGKLKKALFVRQLNVPPFGFRHIIHYGWLNHNIAYIHIMEMRRDKGITEKAINKTLDYFKEAQAYIIDIRENIGGYAGPIKESLARKFVDGRRLWALSYIRNGPAHTDFSNPEPKYIDPDDNKNLSHIPVMLLTNKNTQSAAELFTMMMDVLPNVTIVGDTTMGIFSDTRLEKLPNGWEYRLSIMKTTNHKGVWLEGKGIDPDIFVKNTEDDIKKGVDRVLEKAIDLITSSLTIDTNCD